LHRMWSERERKKDGRACVQFCRLALLVPSLCHSLIDNLLQRILPNRRHSSTCRAPGLKPPPAWMPLTLLVVASRVPRTKSLAWLRTEIAATWAKPPCRGRSENFQRGLQSAIAGTLSILFNSAGRRYQEGLTPESKKVLGPLSQFGF